MWHAAAFWDPAALVLPVADALAIPEIARYIEGWGRPGDRGLVAEDGGERLGAAWYRTFTASDAGYGFVADDTPELAIAVVERARGTGVGASLLEALASSAASSGVPALSLSVSAGNPARRLYERAGFVEVGRDGGGSITMLRRL
jgi:GNAT superfamily N-acetyltransferase